ncbi:UDP-N-acetylmuramoyl-L-alanine--D-glutamate ligase [Candidatus Uhrbacteria bacterium]|nr:UDP-N-acetylmuramoyl-L-alanine--D-glutamate ligase [Candidatus Uhrbacteria bacterium]MBD3284635.1 UDP-N-acetylmuramoyl-L-alanine--D-glutamate ligase [Candidatus Uhrbacteria bacterium]
MSPTELLRAPFEKSLWKGRRVLILGLGQFPQGSGMSAAYQFAKLGADVRVTDLKSAKELGSNVRKLKAFKNVKFTLGKHLMKEIDWAELIVANPRVRPDAKELKRARKNGTPVTSDIALFLDRCPATVVAVTGTRGKSTTASLIAAILKACPKTVWLGGNILVSPLTFLSNVKSSDVVVLELSSWQCESLSKTQKAPTVSVITNLLHDHLNTYDGMDDYAEAKAQIFRHQQKDDVVVLNADDAYGKQWIKEAPSVVRTFGKAAKNDATIKNGWIQFGSQKIFDLRKLQLLGAHNEWNATIAALASRQAGAGLACIKKGLKTFQGLEHRLQLVAMKKGIRYVNDTCATTPDGVIAAMHALKRGADHLWLIMGGQDKQLDYTELGKAFKKQRTRLGVFLLPGTASEKIFEELTANQVAVERVEDLDQAVRRTASLAVKGDAVVLSPGAASFGQFKNEFERGATFIRLVRNIT